jgi:hypothetical protein
MKNSFVQWLLMLLVIVYPKSGEPIFFSNANLYIVENSNGAKGAGGLYLEIYHEEKGELPEKIASFNWDAVKYVEDKKDPLY